MISAGQWKAYNEAVAAITDQARDATAAEMRSWLFEHPTATLDETREEAARILSVQADVYSRAAAALAADWYDAQGRAAGMRLDRAVTSVTVDGESLSKTVHYQMGKCVGGDVGGFCDALGEWAENQAKRALNETIVANAKRDKKKGVKFARVTSGRNTCSFCLMLASRGAVYHTRKSAGELGQYHRHCSCKIVPSYSGNQYEVLVEGHDPKDALKLWQECERIEGLPNLNGSQRKLLTSFLLTSSQPVDEIIRRLESGPSSAVLFSDGQMGKKFGKHCGDWGLDPSSADGRLELLRVTADIIDYADEVTAGEWRGRHNPCLFYRRGEDIVIVDADKAFVTVMKGGANNKRYKSTL